MKRHICSTIKLSDENHSVIDFLTCRFPYFSREDWFGHIEAGRILLNGQKTGPETMLALNDQVAFHPVEIPEPPVSTDYQVLYEDDVLLAVNKPGNLPCHPSGRYFRHTLWALLKADNFGKTLHFIHRLDRETSGVVLLAKTAEAAQICQAQFLNHSVRKTYRVWLEGNFPERLDAEGVLARDTDSLIRKKQRFYPQKQAHHLINGKKCRTVFKRLLIRENLSLVEALPMSGRLHQIRATLFSVGFPVVGDKIYGVDETIFLRFIDDALTEKDREKLRMNRQALHAASLEMNHPLTGERLLFEAPVPEDISKLVHQRGRQNSTSKKSPV